MFSKFINKSGTFQHNMSVSKNHNDTTPHLTYSRRPSSGSVHRN